MIDPKQNTSGDCQFRGSWVAPQRAPGDAHKTMDIESARLLVRYEPETGKLFWRERGQEWFGSARHWKGWNKRHAGSEITTAKARYISVCFFRHSILAHRLIWAMAHDEWPLVIDHIDGDGTNNRLENLRSVLQGDNTRNRRIGTTNKSGMMGVTHIPKRGTRPEMWTAMLGRKRLGRFLTPEEAAAAYRAAANSAGFHPNHGRAA